MANPNSPTTNVLPPTSGMYYCLVTDPCGNSNLDSIYVTIHTPPTITASVSTDSVCLGGSFIATGSGAVSYSWSGGVTDGVPFIPASTSNYTVTGTDANGCTNVAIAAVEVLPLPSVMAGASATTVCSGDSVTLFGIGSATFAWDNGVTDNIPTLPVSNTMYHVTGTDMYGCANSDSIFITVNTSPTLFPLVTGAPYCSGDSANLSVSGANIIVWNPGSLSGSNVTVSPTVPTMYTVTGTDSITGCSTTDSIFVDVWQNPSLVASGDTSCMNSCGQLDAIVTGGTPAYTYLWFPSSGLSSTTIANPVACNTVTTCYTISVTDANGCMAMQTICSFVNQLPTVSAQGPSTVCVNDGNYPLTGNPAGGTFSGPGVTGSSFSPSNAGNGTHSVVYNYTDSNGCDASDTLTIVVSPCVGITESSVNNGINVYPNPFGPELIINLTETSNVRMINSLGEVMFEQEYNAGRNEVSTSAYANGIYFLEFTSANAKTTIRIVKSN